MKNTLDSLKIATLSGALFFAMPLSAQADHVANKAVKGAVAGATVSGVTGGSVVGGAVVGATVGAVHGAIQKKKYDDAKDRAIKRHYYRKHRSR